MTTDLNTVVDILHSTLKEAVRRHTTYEDIHHTSAHVPVNLAVENRKAIGTLSLALVQALAEQRQRGEEPANTTTLKVVNS